MNKTIGNIRAVWDNLIGDAAEFSMENRAFNYVCISTFPMLATVGVFDLFIAQFLMSGIIVLLLLVLCGVYYFSRYKKNYQGGIVIYAVLSYVTLILNYYINSGISGPTIILFCLTFHLLIAIGKPKQFILWISLHLAIVIVLVCSEYLHPGWVPDTYLTRRARFFDILSNFAITIAYIFGITNYLRKSFENERALAEERAQAIMEQNIQITEQNKALEKVNEEKNRLFSIVSHDLKSPMDAINGYLLLISDDYLQGEEKAKIEAELIDQTKYTSDLLVNLLTWAKMQMEGITMNPVRVNMKELVEETMVDKMTIAARKDISLSVSVNEGIEVMTDKDMLQIVLRNLLKNALKFTPEGGEISVKVRRKNNVMELSVRDTGMGIPTDRRDQLFTLKTRSTYGTNKEKGTGLGLMMCKEFMDSQNGAIWFESKLGVGSVFYITLPVLQS